MHTSQAVAYSLGHYIRPGRQPLGQLHPHRAGAFKRAVQHPPPHIRERAADCSEWRQCNNWKEHTGKHDTAEDRPSHFVVINVLHHVFFFFFFFFFFFAIVVLVA
jgi:hypothetical protein